MSTDDRSSVQLIQGNGGLATDIVGGKAAAIDRMMALGLRVPPAFVLTTEVCRRYFAEDCCVPPDVWEQVVDFVHRLEEVTGRIFGGCDKPLLVSVRSGAAVSMPGMMDTVLNVGIAESSTAGSIFETDIRRRLVEQFDRVVGRALPENPWEQLRLAVGAVFESWTSHRAVVYRRNRNIPDSIGTAVVVQAMVFGNLDEHSGTGVMFTRDPQTGQADVYGEWLPRGQGEEVVSGRVGGQPLIELSVALPEVHRELMTAAAMLERHGRDVQDIEFTVESGKLWLLQTRAATRSPEAAIRHAVAMVREGLIDRDEALTRVKPEHIDAFLRPRIDPASARYAPLLAQGKPASPGIGVGVIVVDVEAAEVAVSDVVLATPSTNPDDVPAMTMANAVVTEHGGVTSHAAVVCREMAVPCVVGCGTGTVTALAGRLVTVDGYTGAVYEGALPILAQGGLGDPDVAALAEWARGQSDSRSHKLSTA